MSNEREVETHPSYVMVAFSRCTGNPGPMFGSTIESHHTYITLRIVRGRREHELGRDWFYPADRHPLIEVSLSAAQFAELLTTMNVDAGVPGTMTCFDGKSVPRPPRADLESTKVRDGFRKDMEKLAKDAARGKAEIETLLAKKNLSQADRAEITSKLAMLVQQIRSNAPFMLDQFEEAAEKVVVAAKAEVDAFMTHATIQAGLKALAEGAATSVPAPALPPKKTDKP